MPDAVQGQLRSELDDGGRIFRAAMQARAPKATGAVRAGLSHRILPKTLRLKIGYVGGKRQIEREGLFYARIQDLGRKAQVVKITRGPRKGRSMRIRAMPGKRFVTGRYPEARVAFGRRLLKAYERGVAIAMRGMRS